MNHLLKGITGLVLLLSAGTSMAGVLDPMWMFKDGVNTIFADFQYCDTARVRDYLCYAQQAGQLPDTGDSYDGSRYINFNYTFTTDSLIIRDEFDPSIIHYKDWRPGFAGFKTAWDVGMVGFPLPRFKNLVFAHKGPNPAHKVTVWAWYNDGACGSPSYKELIGEFQSSAEWKVETIAIPESIRNKPDIERNTYKYFEFVFLINNIDPNGPVSGVSGSLKIDDMRLTGCNPIDTSPKPLSVKSGEAATFKVYADPSNPGDVLTYQWKKDGVDIGGAVNAEYTIASAKSADAGNYSVAVKVSSSGDTFVSTEAALAIEGGCGCGSGTGLALIPPLLFKVMANRKRKKRSQKTA